MRILLLSTADTDLLAARASGADYRLANPARVAADAVPALLDGTDLAVVRLLGGRQAWPDGLAAMLAAGVPTVVLGGESVPDAELMAASTVASGVATQALAYLVEGGPENLTQLARFLSDTVLLTGEGFAPPAPTPPYGVHGAHPTRADRPTVGIVFYRAHALAGNTGFVDTLAEAVTAAGGNPLPIFCGSLRGLTAGAGPLGLFARCDALVVTVLAAGGTVAADASAGGDDDAWDVGALAALDVPVIQALCLTSTREQWAGSDAGLSPLDAAMQVAIPEFDGRIVTVPFSFKRIDADGLSVYAADPERAARVAGIAVRQARLRHVPNADKRVAVVLSSYPTKHSRVGNAVGLDTPASAVRLLADLAEVYAAWGGYAYGPGLDGREARADMERSFARIAVAVKNQDTREHDIVDSDDYFQYHGGMVAMVRHLTGATPAAYVGDSAMPHDVRTRTLGEETRRVFRARVVNPRWIAAMRRHGYKGAFELAATVDYLFGYDPTAGVVDDWMYEHLAEAYVFDAETRAFLERSNPWALRGITERLLEAADRGLWAEPEPATLDRLRETYLATEGDLEEQK